MTLPRSSSSTTCWPWFTDDDEVAALLLLAADDLVEGVAVEGKRPVATRRKTCRFRQLMQSAHALRARQPSVVVEDGVLDAGKGQLALEGNIESMQQDDIRSGRQLLAEPDRRSGDRREIDRDQQPLIRPCWRLFDHQHRTRGLLAQQAPGRRTEQDVAQGRLTARAEDEQSGTDGLGVGKDDRERSTDNDLGVRGDTLMAARLANQSSELLPRLLLEPLLDLWRAAAERFAQTVDGIELDGMHHTVGSTGFGREEKTAVNRMPRSRRQVGGGEDAERSH